MRWARNQGEKGSVPLILFLFSLSIPSQNITPGEGGYGVHP